MSFIVALLTGICLSVCTGFRAFLPPFLFGFLHLLFPDYVYLPSSLAFLSQTPTLIALGAAVMVEILGDKFPVIDHALDVIHWPVKMAIGTILTFSLLPAGDYTWFYVLMALILGGGTSTVVHTTKASFRVGSTATTAGTLNPVISVVEEGFSFFGTILTLFLPLFAVIFFIVLMVVVLRYLFKSKDVKGVVSRNAKPSFAMFHFARITTGIFFKLFNRNKIEGREFLPKSGPFVVVGNHSSMIDGFLLGIAVEKPVFTMVKQEAFKNVLTGWFLRKALAFPVDRDRADSSAIRMAFRVLKEGSILGIFPEGTRNRAGLMRPFKPGALRVALKCKVPIVPAYIGNSHLFSPDGTWFPRPVKLFFKFGAPLDVLSLLSANQSEEQIQKLLYERVCELGAEITGRDIRDRSDEEPYLLNNSG